MKNITAIVCLLALFADLSATASVSSWDAVATNEVVLIVNGSQIKKQDIVDTERFWETLFDNRRNQAKSNRERFLENVHKNMFNEIAEHRMYLTNTNIADLVIDKQMLKRHENKMLRQFGKSKEKFSDFFQRLKSAGVSSVFEQWRDAEIKFDRYIAIAMSNETIVAEKEIDDTLAFIKRYNDIASVTNNVTLALASNLVQRARGGEDFSALARKYSAGRENLDGGCLGACFADEFSSESPEYWNVVGKLKPGEVSGILTTSEGYEIVKNVGSKSFTPDEGIELARIFLRKPYFFPEQTRDEIRQDLLVDKMLAAHKKAKKLIFQTSKIEYPLGKGVIKLYQGKERRK